MQEIYRLIEMAAPSPAPVLILGETGTGKELVARTIHELSPRAKGPFVAVNCSAIPETLLESELFGHEKGSFTGAMARRPGYFELADGGTIFLDEIAEMSPNLQAKYLRVLQDSQVRRIGGHDEVSVDVRVVCATNKDVVKAVQEGAFREDLYYRVNVLTIPLPPLRRRPEDTALLAEAFMAEFNDKYERQVRGIDEAALKLLRDHAWPGNVRELRNVIERAVVSCEDGLITADCLPIAPLGAAPTERANVVGAAGGHHARRRREAAHPENTAVGEQQQDPCRRDPRDHAEDAAQQGAAVAGASGRRAAVAVEERQARSDQLAAALAAAWLGADPHHPRAAWTTVPGGSRRDSPVAGCCSPDARPRHGPRTRRRESILARSRLARWHGAPACAQA